MAENEDECRSEVLRLEREAARKWFNSLTPKQQEEAKDRYSRADFPKRRKPGKRNGLK